MRRIGGLQTPLTIDARPSFRAIDETRRLLELDRARRLHAALRRAPLLAQSCVTYLPIDATRGS